MSAHKGQRPLIESSLTWRILEGDAIIVSPRNGKIRVLNQSGAFIWQLLAAEQSILEISNALVEQYEISQEQAFLDLEAFLHDLTQRGLVQWEPAA
jgi:hypothetical protein